MRKCAACVLMTTLALSLTACGGQGDKAEDLLLRTRSRYLEMTACAGHADIRADYGQRVYDYGVDFSWEKEGETRLTLTAPETVAGTTAHIARGETALEYDGVMLATGPLDSAGLTPVDALPAILSAAREGFFAECALEDDGAALHAVCRDPESGAGEGTETELWFSPDTGALTGGEIAENGVTVIQCAFTDFTMQGPGEE